MSNVIELDTVRINDEVKATIAAYEGKLKEEEARINDKHTELKSVQVLLMGAKKAEVVAIDKKEKAANNRDVKQLALREKQIKDEIDVIETSRSYYDIELTKLNTQLKKEFIANKNSTNALKVFDDLNIHYVVFEQQWYSIDVAGDRTEIKINASEHAVIRDLIYLDSRWDIQSENELKKIAVDLGRVYKHIVRDFLPATRSGVYNQMNDIRKYWLEPIYDKTPHEAFRILCLSVAGGSDEYADQLERYIAYRYCHPEDVMIPNIDSCATGGTGRETYYNLFKMIFTEICCTSAGKETFCGTHNGELFGKMIIKVDEKNSQSVPVDIIKELTGGLKYRHRSMNKDARDVVRLFSFLLFRNGFTTTVRLAGTGSSGEDRRWEPIIARVNLTRHVSKFYGITSDINTLLKIEEEKAALMLIKDWQKDYWRNETAVAEWLGYIINKYDAKNMTELLPIHGEYYTEMISRQKRGVDGFMPKYLSLVNESTVISIKDAWKLYEASESTKVSKDWFGNQMKYWLNSKMGWDCEEEFNDVYPFDGAHKSQRRKFTFIHNKLDTSGKPHVFNLEDFIDPLALDEKEKECGSKICSYSLRDELR